MPMEKIYENPQRGQVNCLLSNLRLSYRGDCGKVDVIWLVFHDTPSEKMEDYAASPMHKHMFCETHACLRGTADYITGDGSRFHLGPGDVLFIPPDCMHRGTGHSPDMSKVAFAFAITDEEGHERSELRASLPTEPACFRASQEVCGLFGQIMDEAVEHGPFYVDSIEALAFRVVVLYARLLAPAREWLDFASPDKQVVDGRVRELSQYVDAHLAENIAVGDVADALHLSVKQVNRLLQKEFMLNCGEYIERRRAERAKELLAFTDMRVEEVAAAVGYASAFSFSKFFKRVAGMSPSLFRSSRFKQN